MRVAIIVRGGLEIGMGHVSRCLTIAEEMRDRAEIIFFSNRDDIVVNYIKNRSFFTQRYSDNSEIITHLKLIHPETVIIDKLDVEEDFARALKKDLNPKLVIFSNLTVANKFADIVVNAVMGQIKNYQIENLKYLDKNTNTLYFWGPRYLTLRKEFFEWKKRGKRFSDNIERILLIFGGSDPSNLSTLALNELLKSNYKYKIDIILGAKFANLDEMNRIIDLYPENKMYLNVYRNVSNLSELMYKANLVICSPGASLFEALCVGTPIIAVNQNSLQKSWFEGFIPTLDKNQISKIRDIIISSSYINPDSELVKKMEIGEGKEELVKTILGEI